MSDPYSCNWLQPGTPEFEAVFPKLPLLRRPQDRVALQQLARLQLIAYARAALRRLGSYDEALVEDVTHDFILQIYERSLLAAFDPRRGTMEAFIKGIMRFMALACLRRHRRLHFSHEVDQLDPASDRFDPLILCGQRDLALKLWEWVDALSDRYREAICMHYMWTDEMTGVTPAKSRDAVKLHRAVGRLRRRAGVEVKPLRRRTKPRHRRGGS